MKLNRLRKKQRQKRKQHENQFQKISNGVSVWKI